MPEKRIRHFSHRPVARDKLRLHWRRVWPQTPPTRALVLSKIPWRRYAFLTKRQEMDPDGFCIDGLEYARALERNVLFAWSNRHQPTGSYQGRRVFRSGSARGHNPAEGVSVARSSLRIPLFAGSRQNITNNRHRRHARRIAPQDLASERL